jgi:hypothetical protein
MESGMNMTSILLVSWVFDFGDTLGLKAWRGWEGLLASQQELVF